MKSHPKSSQLVIPVDISPGSKPVITSLQKQKEQLFNELQYLQQSRFFDGESVFDVTVNDIIDDCFDLTKYDVKDVADITKSNWELIFKSCVYNQTGNGPLDPISAVKKYTKTNKPDRFVLRFNTDDTYVTEIDDTANIVIQPHKINFSGHITDAELYPGYGVAADVDSLNQYINEFDYVSLIKHSEKTAAFLEDVAGDEVQRDIGTVELSFGYESEKRRPIPPREDSFSDRVQESVDMLSDFDSLSSDAFTIILTILSSDALTSDLAIKLIDLLAPRSETDTVLIDWGMATPEPIITSIIRLTDYTIISLPQRGKALITPPNSSLTPSEDFPERQTLEDVEIDCITSLIPKYVTFPGWTEPMAAETLYYLIQSQSLSQEDLLAYLIQPYSNVTPREKHVATAISEGHRLTKLIKEMDKKYGTALFDKVLEFKQQKVQPGGE